VQGVEKYIRAERPHAPAFQREKRGKQCLQIPYGARGDAVGVVPAFRVTSLTRNSTPPRVTIGP